MNLINKPEIAVIGAGAIGSLVGGILARAGEDVTLVGNTAHVEAVRRDGLKVSGAAGNFTVSVKATAVLDFRPDIVFIAVKNQDVEETCREIETYIDNAPVVMMQNGVSGAEMAAAFFKRADIVSCILILNASFLAPGEVNYVKQNPIVIGKAFTENDAAVSRIQKLLNLVAPTRISPAVTDAQWTKLFINAMSNALDGMTGLSQGEYIRYPQMSRIGVSILQEALQLMNAAGIEPVSLPGFPLFFFKLMLRMPPTLAARLLRLTIKLKGDESIRTSTLQSLLKGKPTEIDYLNGEFVRLGRQLSLPAPINLNVVKLIHEIERTGRFFSPDELTKYFQTGSKSNCLERSS